MKRLLAVTCVVWMAACSTAPSATTASGPDDTQAPATTVRPPTTSTEAPAATQRDGGNTVTTGTPATAAVSTTTTRVVPTATSSTVSGTSTTSTAVATTTTTTEAEPELVEVEIENFRFVPAEVTVRVGDTVRWSITSGTHTTTADGAVWSSPAMASGESFAWTFDTPGTFDYFCAIHPGMRGTITVEG